MRPLRRWSGRNEQGPGSLSGPCSSKETSQKRAAPAKEQVYRELKAAILSLELKPGQAIVESVVGELYGISRSGNQRLARLLSRLAHPRRLRPR